MRPLRIVLLASELAPLAKTGGLADVTGALARHLAARGHEVHAVLPCYRGLDPARWGLQKEGFQVHAALPGRREAFDVLATPPRPGAPRLWALAHPFFDRPGLYGDIGGEYGDNALRFGAFGRAALDLAHRVCPSPDVLHLHDWQAGLVAADLRAPGVTPPPGFEQTRVVFTIHNLGYTGSFGPEALDALGLPAALFDAGALEFYGRVSFLKAGLVYADVLTTVSPRYAREIQTAEFGHGLDALLRRRSDRLFGILNGIDTREWNPATDPHLPARFDADDLSGKRACRDALRAELGLAPDAPGPLFGVVSRLAWQKGIDLVAELAESLAHRGCQLALLGTGEPGLEARLQELAGRHPHAIAVRPTFDEALAHRIVAGSDAFLMPSRYEPCGLTQMYALRYGTAPVVRAVGGLDDTVDELDTAHHTGNGFKFGAATASALWATLQRVFVAHAQPHAWADMQLRGMSADLSWERSAQVYERIFYGLATPASAAAPAPAPAR